MAKILAFDISASPGVAVLEVKNGKPKLVYVDSVKTTSKHKDAQRYAYVEAFAVKAVHENGPFDAVIRENYTGGRSKRAKQLVYGAWSMIDKALSQYGYFMEDKSDEIAASKVKKAVGGKGIAGKDEVEAGVKRILGDKIEFKTDDESDAAAIALTYAIEEGMMSNGFD